MAPHAFDKGSAADRAAKKDGRFFGGKVYATKRAAEAARQASTAVGRGRGPSASPKKKTGGGAVVPKKGRVSVVVAVRHVMTSDANATSWGVAISGCGEGPAAVAAFKARHPVVKGVRAEVRFPLHSTHVRWAVATVRTLSDGHKSVQAVSAIKGAQVFDEGLTVRWVTVSDVSGAVYKEDDGGNTLFTTDEARHAVFAVQSVAEVVGVTVQWHITLEVDSEASASTSVDL
jgi:hypothetical protein